MKQTALKEERGAITTISLEEMWHYFGNATHEHCKTNGI